MNLIVTTDTYNWNERRNVSSVLKYDTVKICKGKWNVPTQAFFRTLGTFRNAYVRNIEKYLLFSCVKTLKIDKICRFSNRNFFKITFLLFSWHVSIWQKYRIIDDFKTMETCIV